MTPWLVSLLFAGLAAELLLRLPLIRLGRSMLATARRAGRVILSPHISEHWKELVMPAYTAQLARGTCALGGTFALAGLALFALLLLLDRLAPGLALLLGSPAGIMAGFVFGSAYIAARQRLVRA